MMSKIKALIASVTITTWFLAHTWRGFLSYFTGDDMMNLYWAWTVSLPKLAFGIATPFNSVYLPVGALFYRVLFSAAGFYPLPFRVCCYAFLLLNIWLLYRIGKVIT